MSIYIVPKLAYLIRIWNGCYLEAVIEIRTSNAYLVPGTAVEDQALHPWFTGIYGYQWWRGNFTGESGDFTAIARVG